MVRRVEEAPEHFVGQGDESEEVGEPEEEDGDDELAEQEEDWDRDRVEDPFVDKHHYQCGHEIEAHGQEDQCSGRVTLRLGRVLWSIGVVAWRWGCCCC